MPPKILNPETKKMSDEEQKMLALFSESFVGEPAQNPRSPGSDRSPIADDLFDEKKRGFLDSLKDSKIKRRFG